MQAVFLCFFLITALRVKVKVMNAFHLLIVVEIYDLKHRVVLGTDHLGSSPVKGRLKPPSNLSEQSTEYMV